MEKADALELVRKPIPENVRQMWGDAANSGYQAVPHTLFRFQHDLMLSNGELVTLLNILDFWWHPDKKPFPGASILAKRMGVDIRSVHRHLKSLIKKGYVGRDKGRSATNSYDLKGLVEALNGLVKRNAGLEAKYENKPGEPGVLMQ